MAPTSVVLPEDKQNCQSLYGDQYVIMACKDRCKSTACPLKVLEPNHCRAEFHKGRSLSITREQSKLTFVVSSSKAYVQSGFTEESLQNNLFHCANDRCVSYEKLCNLVDDCGDHSDEENCTSVFHCNVSNNFIPSSEKCNGVVQCNDYTDECNDQCGKEIITGLGFKMVCWVIGLIAVVLNMVRIVQNAIILLSDRMVSQKEETVLGLLINLGDFLTGAYLLSIVVIDTVIYGKNYCKQQYVWLSSTTCSLLGIISTVGTQLSLFAMTLLSLSRLFEVLKFKVQAVKYFSLKMLMVVTTVTCLSLVMAVGPLMSSYEDVFVNGMTYNPKIKLFLPYVNKKTHSARFLWKNWDASNQMERYNWAC